ncbi:ATP-dependent nuclease [Faecalicatena contorta]|uniref:Predicted ATP-dependent endonuclease of the OLD family, contains P-loop ATPase and TOPRIM domains n=1 Tax=Faecalicatena contorta TaxID=39482 RepID=A0A315ZWN3_9FIRM|nr:AAA family ATPase [Faecalicatena contorta]PWJ50051.1 putative ATP-dependent endonuclease of OLD family [Faecalicatena contorta]SUQ14172.1 Predicted ATP-dependent endonuclease of the OLD family, contains P-loop ATPase and TOPRIM domains [Faecalicatena contorta]
MKITSLRIRNFKSIRDMYIKDIENALILVGQNNTGKTAVLDAIRAVGGSYRILPEDFRENFPNVEVSVSLEIGEDDLLSFQKRGVVSRYRRMEAWREDFRKKLPSYDENGILTFDFTVNKEGNVRYNDGVQKNNRYIKEVFPQIYYMDTDRDLDQLQGDLLMLQEDELLKRIRSGCCIFDRAKMCNHCFACIGLINQKKPEELDAFETAKLLDYKLYQLNLNEFAGKVNENFRKNGGQEEIIYSMNRDVERMLLVTTEIRSRERTGARPITQMGKGMRSVYMLSLLETYAEGEDGAPGIVMVEDPEIFLHPKLQKVSGEILYRLSRKNQVIFSTHSPNLLFNFNSRQIRQTVLDEMGCSAVRETTDISTILDDLGYTANDLLNVNFVFIVEGKQDKSRLPLLIKKYYSETYDKEGNLSRIAIITTNSCTNIKTYANLKYMNQIYLKDQFLMIRDGDGEDPEKLKRQLCRYYEERSKEDADKLPRVLPQNVLVLHYYSFENYFLNPRIMAQLGIIESEEAFYEIFLGKWKEYLHKIRSGRHLLDILGRDLETVKDVKEHMEEIKIYMRGHNLYDIYYGRYKEQEQELLGKYIDLAQREDFQDILDSIDRFIYFESRKKEEK